jgi:hypothetical protein
MNPAKSLRLLTVLIILSLILGCSTPKKRFRGLTISPPVPGKGDDVVLDRPFRTVGIARSGNFSGGFSIYTGDPDEIRAANAAEGAGIGVGATIELAVATGGIGIIAAPVLVPLGILIGAAEGLPVGKEEADELYLLAEEAMGYSSFQENLASEIARQGQELEMLELKTFDLACTPGYDCPEDFWDMLDHDAVLEVQVILVGLTETGYDTRPLQLAVSGWSRLIRSRDQEIIRARPFVLRGMSQKTRHWIEGGAGQLKEDIQSYTEFLASGIIRAMFTGPDTVPVLDDKYCWVQPIEPGDNKQLSAFVDTSTPLLRWTPFESAAAQSMAGTVKPPEITDITYDLKVLHFHYKSGYNLFEEQMGLTNAEYRISKPLEPGEQYLWNVKVNFRENGIPRSTGFSHRLPRGLPRGWQLKKNSREEDTWPVEWSLTRAERSAIPKSQMRSLACSGMLPIYQGAWNYYRIKFKQ